MDAACDTLPRQTLSLSRAARTLFPLNNGRPVHHATLTRWSDRGCRARDGRTIKLRTWVLGNQRVTSAEAVEEFLRELNAEPQTTGGPERAA